MAPRSWLPWWPPACFLDCSSPEHTPQLLKMKPFPCRSSAGLWGQGVLGGKGSRVLGLAGQGQVGGGEEKGLRHRAHGPLSLDAAAVLAQEPWQPWMLPVEAEALGSGRSCESWHLGCSGPLC